MTWNHKASNSTMKWLDHRNQSFMQVNIKNNQVLFLKGDDFGFVLSEGKLHPTQATLGHAPFGPRRWEFFSLQMVLKSIRDPWEPRLFFNKNSRWRFEIFFWQFGQMFSVYLADPWTVDLYGFHVGKFTIVPWILWVRIINLVGRYCKTFSFRECSWITLDLASSSDIFCLGFPARIINLVRKIIFRGSQFLDFPNIIVHEVWVGNDPPKGQGLTKRASGAWRFSLMSFL